MYLCTAAAGKEEKTHLAQDTRSLTTKQQRQIQNKKKTKTGKNNLLNFSS